MALYLCSYSSWFYSTSSGSPTTTSTIIPMLPHELLDPMYKKKNPYGCPGYLRPSGKESWAESQSLKTLASVQPAGRQFNQGTHPLMQKTAVLRIDCTPQAPRLWKNISLYVFWIFCSHKCVICNLVFQFWQTLVTSVPGTRHVRSTYDLLSSTVVFQLLSKLLFLPGCPGEQLCVQPAPVPDPAGRACRGLPQTSGCSVWEDAEAKRPLRNQSRVYPGKATKTACGLQGPSTKHSQQPVQLRICPAHSCLSLKASTEKPTGFSKE